MIKSIPKDQQIGDMRESLIFAFQQLRLQLGILDNGKLDHDHWHYLTICAFSQAIIY